MALQSFLWISKLFTSVYFVSFVLSFYKHASTSEVHTDVFTCVYICAPAFAWSDVTPCVWYGVGGLIWIGKTVWKQTTRQTSMHMHSQKCGKDTLCPKEDAPHSRGESPNRFSRWLLLSVYKYNVWVCVYILFESNIYVIHTQNDLHICTACVQFLHNWTCSIVFMVFSFIFNFLFCIVKCIFWC